MKSVLFIALAILAFQTAAAQEKSRDRKSTTGVLAPKPVFRDPVYDGAADPIVIWNPLASKWWMFYTNRRATMTNLPGVSWVFGTPIGIAESADGAKTGNMLALPILMICLLNAAVKIQQLYGHLLLYRVMMANGICI